MSEKIDVELHQRQVKLLLRYAHPFKEEQSELDAFKNKPGIHALSFSNSGLFHLISDLVNTSKKIRDNDLLQEFDEICCALEMAEKYKSSKH